jgi:hypothetical protein
MKSHDLYRSFNILKKIRPNRLRLAGRVAGKKEAKLLLDFM